MQQGLCRLRSFARNKAGNVAVLFGLALIPIVIGVGAAIDYGRALVVRDHMADAADAAALAIASWPGLTQAQQTAKAQQFFTANYPPTKLGTVGTLNVAFAGDNINVSVSGTVQTTFMKLANINTLAVGANAVITKKERNIELVLVLDTTGSMASAGKLTALKSSAKQLVSTLFNGQSTSNSVKIGVVPFAAAVNVGPNQVTANPTWFDLKTYTAANAAADPVAFEDLDKTSGVNTYNLYHNSGNSLALKSENWAGCVRERSSNSAYELTDAPPSSSDPASRWVPYFAPDEPDKASNTTFDNTYLCDNPKKCSSGNSTTAPSATCACPPGITCTSTNDQRQCYSGKYKGATVSGGEGPDMNCPPAAITPLTNVASTINSAIDALVAKGSTVIPAGLLWGWRVISPTPPFTDGTDYANDKVIKAVVLLTDGENDASAGSNGNNKSDYNAFGYAKNGHLGSTSGSNADSTLDTKTLTVCSAIKNVSPSNPVQLYTIGLGVTSASQTLLTNCAGTDDQGNKLFYNSPSADQLASIFQDIAQGLSELRIAQ